MKRSISNLNNNLIFYPLALLASFITFYPAILSRFLVDIDFDYTFGTLDAFGFLDYLSLKVTIIDVQPMRDLFMIFMLKVQSLFKHQLFGFFNFLLWTGSVLILEKILQNVTSRTSARWISLCVLLHPIAAWTLYWPTAIKHLLALFFMTLSAYFTILFKSSKGKRYNGLFAFLFYLLALNSQPIILLYPIVLILYLFSDLKSRYTWPLIIFSLIAMVFYGWANFFYYGEVYPLFVGSKKMDPITIESIVLNVFGLSRSLSQIVLPLNFAVNYSYSSPINFIGLPLFALSFVLLSIKYSRRHLLFFGAAILFPLAVIYGKKTNIFVSDTYLLVPLFSFSLLFAFLLPKFKNVPLALVFLMVCLGLKSHQEIKITSTESTLFKTSYEREPECKNAFSYSSYLLYALEVEKFKRIANTSLANGCLLLGGGSRRLSSELYSLLIFFSEDTDTLKKIELISKAKNKTPIVYYVLDKLKVQVGILKREESLLGRMTVDNIQYSRKELFKLLRDL